MGTYNTISPKLAETAEMWQCSASFLYLIYSQTISSAAKYCNPEPDHKQSNRNNVSTHTYAICAHKHMNKCAKVSVLLGGERDGLITRCNAHIAGM